MLNDILTLEEKVEKIWQCVQALSARVETSVDVIVTKLEDVENNQAETIEKISNLGLPGSAYGVDELE